MGEYVITEALQFITEKVKSSDAWLWTIHIFNGRSVWCEQQVPSNNEIILHQEEN